MIITVYLTYIISKAKLVAVRPMAVHTLEILKIGGSDFETLRQWAATLISHNDDRTCSLAVPPR